MIRLIKRYGGGSRKLYDTEESRYISLDEVGGWIRAGQELRVVDNETGDDVTAQTLAQIIYEGEKRGVSFLPVELFHEVIRRGERAVNTSVEQLQTRVGSLVRSSVGRVPSMRAAREEMEALREGIARLEQSLDTLEHRGKAGPPRRRRRGRAASV